MISEAIAERRNVTGCPPSLACARLLSESFLCWRATAANSSAANRSDGLPYELDRAEDRGDHDHDRRGEAYGENVIQHGHPERAFSPFSLSGAGAQE